MNKMENNESKHLELVEAYISLRAMYSLSLKDRIEIDLRYTSIQISGFDEDISALSDEEIGDRLNSLKAPWWHSFYNRKLRKHKILLFFILMILYVKNLILWIPKWFYDKIKR